MKKLIMILSLVILSACEGSTNAPSSKDVTQDMILPKELSECKFYYVYNKTGANLYVAKCGKSETQSMTYPQGKVQAHIILIDGVEYAPK